jgi:uncharacterized protein YciI
MRYFAVTRVQTWERTLGLEEQPLWAEHAAFMDDLVNDGRIAVGGPLGGGPKVLLIFAGKSAAEIEAVLADDPWTKSGQLVTESIVAWEIRLGRDVFSRTSSAQRS